MYKIGYAQEIFTPPTGVDLAGYFNLRLNEGMYDDLMVKCVAFELNGKKFGILSFDLCSIAAPLFSVLKERITAKFGAEIYDNFIFCATHTHTGPRFVKIPPHTMNAPCMLSISAPMPPCVHWNGLL